MKKKSLLSFGSIALFAIICLSSCGNGTYSPEIPNYTPKDSTVVTGLMPYQINQLDFQSEPFYLICVMPLTNS